MNKSMVPSVLISAALLGSAYLLSQAIRGHAQVISKKTELAVRVGSVQLENTPIGNLRVIVEEKK